MPQIIPFVVTAIVSVTSAVVAAGPLAVAAFNAANVLGAAALANEAFKAVQPTVKSSSTAIEWAADPNAPNRFAFGRVGGAGNIIHNATYGPDNMYVGFVGVMSASGPIKGWVGFRAEETPVMFDGSGKAISSYFANVMWLDRLNGTQPAARALASPSGLKSGATIPSWSSSAKLSGKAAYMYTLAENSKQSAYKGKVPTGIHTIEGLYCYDPRFDSTFPGGSGSCRLNNPATWVYSTNAYIHGLNWAIGRWEGLTSGAAGAPYASMKVGGIGARAEAIDFAAYVEGANVFDENAWACAAWPDADQGKAAVLDSFLLAGGGIYAERQGRISCMHRAAPRTSIATITTDDTAGTIEYDTTTSLLDRINTIRPEFWSEANNWQMVATDEVTSSVWRLEDGQGVALTKSKGIQYNYVPGSKQARELACLQVAHTREGIRGTAPLRHYLDLEVGDCITFDVPEAILNGQKVIILNVDPDLEGDIINVTFASESDPKYPFAFGQTSAPPPSPSIVPGDPSYVSPPLVADWSVTVREPSEGGSQVAVFDVVGTVNNTMATGVLIEISPDGAAPWVQVWSGPPTATSIPVSGMQPGVSYFVAISYQRGQNVSGRLIVGPFDTPEIVALSPEDSEALDRLAIIESDNWLSKGEKPEIILQFDAIGGEYSGLSAALLAAGLTTARTNYVAAYNALVAYLTGLTPAWNDVGTDTVIVGTDLRNAFKAYYVAKQAGNNALSGAAAADASAALARIVAIESDGVLSKGEKPEVIRQVTSLNDEYAGLAARGADAGQTAAVDTYTSAVAGLNNYLATLSPAWNSLSVDTPITGTTFRAAFNTAYVAKQALLNAILGINTQNSQDALAALDIIASDNWLSKGEKPELIRQYTVINGEYPALETQATALGLTTPLTALANAITAMNSYLAGLTPAWNDLAENTPITGATLRSSVAACYTAKTALQNAMVNTVGVDAAGALSQLGVIASDSWLSKGEKPEVIRQVTSLNSEYTALADRGAAVGATSTVATYSAAVSALLAYMGGLSPAYTDLTADTPIVGTTFRAKFNDAYVAKQAVINAVLASNTTDAHDALDKLTAIASDNVLSAGEKSGVILEYNVINGEYTGLAAQATALGVSTPLTTLANAISALNSYLAGLSPAWNTVTVDTPIVGTTFRSKFADCYTAKSALQGAMALAANATGQAALDQVTRISSDAWLSAGEKPEIIRQHGVLNGDYTGLAAQASALGVTTALTNHQNAIIALNNYLASLSPAWNSTTTDTPIVASTFNTYFSNAYTTRQALTNAFAAAISSDAQRALSDLSIIASDNYLSRSEKPEVLRQSNTFNLDYSGLASRATALGVTTELSAHGNAIVALNNYLNGLSPAWNNLSTDTPISGATLRGLFETAYTTKQALLNIMLGKAGGGLPLSVSFSPSRGISRNVSSPGTYTTSSTLVVTISGGSGNYAWEWVLQPATSNGANASTASISGTSGTGNSAGTTFTATVAAGETVFGGFSLVIRDTTTNATITSLHTGRIVNTA